MGFLRPALLLLIVPALYVWWISRPRDRGVSALRLLVLALLIAALALPYARLSDAGRDLVFLIDRSRSMPAEAESRALELIRLAQGEARTGDRVGVIGFGGEAGLERLPSTSDEPFRGFERGIDLDATDIAEALRAGLALIPEGRNGALVLLSDGEITGANPEDAARRAFARGIEVHILPQSRRHGADLSIERVELPGEVAVGEPFQFSVWVRADTRVEAAFELQRGNKTLSSGRRVFEPGLNRVFFRDVLLEPGIASYDVRLAHAGDSRPENDAALGAVRARGERRVLVLNHDGSESPLVRALRGAALPLDVARPEDLRLDPISLSRWRAVVLENVSARRLGNVGLQALREHVLERGAGLLMTGGQASFGVGGYHLTAIDELLPVSLEQRQEHRKQGVAIAFVLDTSGSMAAVAEQSTGTTKMQLANAGTMEAIGLLSPLDSVTVLSVDSAPEVVVPLTPVEEPEALSGRVRGIQPGGGGIYVRSGMVAAAELLDRAEQANRHIVLFADAADAEEPEGVSELVLRLGEMGTTVSVIALGTEQDTDADFLKDIAWDGGGEAYFTSSPAELPKLFAQDTLTIARSTFINEVVGVAVLPDVVSLGRLDLTGWPDVDGYNLTYLRSGAFVASATTDEYKAPLLSFWYQGVGRAAAYTGQMGGTHGAGFVSWERFSDVAVTLARWLAGQEEPEELFADVRREGREAVISVEVDPEAATPPDTSSLVARVQDNGGEWREYVLERVGANRYEARTLLKPEGVTLGTVRIGGEADETARVLELPPLALPYSPEFERSPDPERGQRLLRRLAKGTGGIADPTAAQLFQGAREGRAGRVFSRELLLAALLLVLVEVAARRLSLFSSLSTARWRRLLALARSKVKPPRRARVTQADKAQGAPASSRASELDAALDQPSGAGATGGSETGASTAAPARSGDDLAGALSRARQRAGRKTRR